MNPSISISRVLECLESCLVGASNEEVLLEAMVDHFGEQKPIEHRLITALANSCLRSHNFEKFGEFLQRHPQATSTSPGRIIAAVCKLVGGEDVSNLGLSLAEISATMDHVKGKGTTSLPLLQPYESASLSTNDRLLYMSLRVRELAERAPPDYDLRSLLECLTHGLHSINGCAANGILELALFQLCSNFLNSEAHSENLSALLDILLQISNDKSENRSAYTMYYRIQVARRPQSRV